MHKVFMKSFAGLVIMTMLLTVSGCSNFRKIEGSFISFSPNNDQLFYWKINWIGEKCIYIIDVKGSNNWMLVKGFNSIEGISPDGLKIIYSSKGDNINILDLDGSIQENLVIGRFAFFSPDGSKIYYTSSTAPRTDSHYVQYLNIMDLDGSNQRQIAEGSCFQLSPDGSRIFYQSYYLPSYDADIMFMQLDGSGQRKIGKGVLSGISPCGSQIYYETQSVENGEARFFLNTMRFNGLNKQHLFRIEKSGPLYTPNYFFSPDGSKVIYINNEYSYINIMNLDGSNKRRLAAEGEVGGFSPDGSQIYYSENGYIWSVDLNGLNRHQIVEGKFRAFSPDESQIIYSDDVYIWIMDLDGSNQRRLFEGSFVCFSPDGSMIIYETINNNKRYLNIINLDD